MQFVLASHNKKKMAEMAAILSGLDIEVVPLPENAPEPEENGATFEENARIKAETLCARTGCAALADDSGLEVDFLGGEPGVYSARYMGEDTSYEIKNREIIRRLEGVNGPERSARFVCVIAAVLPDGRILEAEGTMEGQIAMEPAGTGGFGYDPILYLPEYGKTGAQLSMEEKNEISHRGKALRAIKGELAGWLERERV